MKNRRNFLRGAGLLSTLVAGVYTGMTTASNTAPTITPEVKEADISHLAPAHTNTNNLMLTANNNPPKPVEKSEICFSPSPYAVVGIGNSSVMCPPEDMNRVKMSVGKDNRLWLYVDDKWKRVVIEG